MPTSKTWPGGASTPAAAAYSIPATGELNWQALSSFLIALADGAQATSFQKFAVRKAIASPVTVSSTTDCIIVTDLTVAGAVTVNLPAGANKQVFIVVDGKGDATSNNITINRNGADTIAGGTSFVIDQNRESVILVYNSGDTDWKIASLSKAGFTNPMTTAGDIIVGGAAGVAARLALGTTHQALTVNQAGTALEYGNNLMVIQQSPTDFTVPAGYQMSSGDMVVDTARTITVAGRLDTWNTRIVNGTLIISGSGKSIIHND